MPLDLPNLDPGIEISVASIGMSKGIEQSDGPQVIARAQVKSGDLQLGAQWKNVSVYPADAEASASIQLSHQWNRLQLTGGLSYKLLTSVTGQYDDCSLEAGASATVSFGKAAVKTSAIYSPDDFGPAKQSLFIEAGPSFKLAKRWTASAAVGHRGRERGVDYFAWNAGISRSFKIGQLDLRYYDTDRHDAGKRYDARLVASVKLSF